MLQFMGSFKGCLRTYYYAAKVQSLVFIHNVSLFETAKMCCEAAIFSIEAIIGIPLPCRFLYIYSFARQNAGGVVVFHLLHVCHQVGDAD